MKTKVWKSDSKNKDEENKEYYRRQEVFLDRAQEDMGDYFTSMLNQWMQAYPSEKRNLIDFKNGLIQGLEDDDLIEQCWSFLSKDPQRESDIWAILISGQKEVRSCT